MFTNENFEIGINIPYNCKFFIIQKIGGNKFLIKEIYYVKYSGPFEVDVGNWFETFGLTVDKELESNRRNMKRVALLRAERDPERNVSLPYFKTYFVLTLNPVVFLWGFEENPNISNRLI